MKLIDELKANSGNIVKVGAMNGFFFIGLADDAVVDIDKINDRYICNYEETIKSLEKSAENAEKKLRNDIRSAKTFIKENEGKEDVNQKHLSRAMKLVALSPEGIKAEAERMRKVYLRRKKRLVDHLKNADRLLNREVIDSYDSILGDGRILIVDGIEEGKYWFPEEYEAEKEGKIDA